MQNNWNFGQNFVTCEQDLNIFNSTPAMVISTIRQIPFEPVVRVRIWEGQVATTCTGALHRTNTVMQCFVGWIKRLKRRLYQESVCTDCWFLPPANVVCEGYDFTGVCLSTGEGLPSRRPPGRETPPARRPQTPWQGDLPHHPSRETPWQGDPPVVRPPSRETPGRETPREGGTPQKEAPPGRPPGKEAPPWQGDPPTASAADGTHPTGMHSCCDLYVTRPCSDCCVSRNIITQFTQREKLEYIFDCRLGGG